MVRGRLNVPTDSTQEVTGCLPDMCALILNVSKNPHFKFELNELEIDDKCCQSRARTHWLDEWCHKQSSSFLQILKSVTRCWTQYIMLAHRVAWSPLWWQCYCYEQTISYQLTWKWNRPSKMPHRTIWSAVKPPPQNRPTPTHNTTVAANEMNGNFARKFEHFPANKQALII